MWYLAVGALLGAWVIFDATQRKFGAWSFVYGLLTLLFWPLAVAVYNARKPLKAGETRQGGTAWNVMRALIFWWTVLMIIAAGTGLSGTGELFGTSKSDTELAGATLGVSLGVGILCIIWFVPAVIALVLAFVLKSSILEEGPTGRLALETSRSPSAASSKTSVSTQQRLQEARDLLKKKKYPEARAILETINHPKAREWLDRLDEMESDAW